MIWPGYVIVHRLDYWLDHSTHHNKNPVNLQRPIYK